MSLRNYSEKGLLHSVSKEPVFFQNHNFLLEVQEKYTSTGSLALNARLRFLPIITTAAAATTAVVFVVVNIVVVIVNIVVFSLVEIPFFSSDITLMDHDTLSSDIVGHRQTLNLNDLELEKVYQKTFVFRKVLVRIVRFTYTYIHYFIYPRIYPAPCNPRLNNSSYLDIHIHVK